MWTKWRLLHNAATELVHGVMPAAGRLARTTARIGARGSGSSVGAFSFRTVRTAAAACRNWCMGFWLARSIWRLTRQPAARVEVSRGRTQMPAEPRKTRKRHTGCRTGTAPQGCHSRCREPPCRTQAHPRALRESPSSSAPKFFLASPRATLSSPLPCAEPTRRAPPQPISVRH